MLPNDIKLAIANTNISKYRKILVKAISAHAASLPTEYDVAFNRGMEHALYLLDQMCRELFEKAIKSEKAKKIEVKKVDIYEEIKELKAANAELKSQIEELTDKHWEECRQIALYDDELKALKNSLNYVADLYADLYRDLKDKIYNEILASTCDVWPCRGLKNCKNFDCGRHNDLAIVNGDRWYEEVKDNRWYKEHCEKKELGDEG